MNQPMHTIDELARLTRHPCGTDPVDVLLSIYRANSMAFGQTPTPEMEAAFVDRLLHELGGAQLYLPRVGAHRRRETHEWIRANWRGNNVAELARASGLSTRRVRQVVGSS